MNNDIFRAIVRLAVKQARQITDDQEALEVKCLYKEFDKQIGNTLNAGEYIQHEGKLYKVLQTHVAQDVFTPGQGTESLFVVIDKEHVGTIEDPIPYEGNMELFEGKYYIENDVVYVCTRNTGAPMYNALKDLVNIYVLVA
jgi:hypothetical protein